MTCSFASDEHKDTCLHSFTHVLLNLSVVVAMRLSEGMFHSCLFLTHTVARFNTLSPTLDHTGTVKAHLEVSDGVPCGLQHILALDPSKRHLKTAMAWTQS